MVLQERYILNNFTSQIFATFARTDDRVVEKSFIVTSTICKYGSPMAHGWQQHAYSDLDRTSPGEQPTVFQAEVFTIPQVATCEEVKKFHEKEIRTYSDSQTPLKTILRHRVSSALVQECRDALKELLELRQSSSNGSWAKRCRRKQARL